MRPEEFTKQLRERTRRSLPESLEFARNAVAEGNTLIEAKLERFMSDPGSALANAGIIPTKQASRANEIILAMYKSVPFNEDMKRAMEGLREDKQFTATMERLAQGGGGVPEQELQQALKRVIEDDRFLTGPLKVMHEDPGIREALGTPPDMTFEDYIQRVRKTIRDSDSLDTILDVATCDQDIDGTRAFWTATICVGIVSIYALAAVVQTVIGAVSYLFVYAVAANAVFAKWTVAVTVDGSVNGIDGRGLPVSDADVESNCINESRSMIWVVVRGEFGFKRVPVPPGKSTAGMGLPVVEAILIGGRSNALGKLHSARDGEQQQGAYVLHKDKGAPGVLTIQQHSDGFHAVVNDAQSAAEAEGRAGYSDLAAGGSAGRNFDGRYRMSDAAAAVPEGFDYVAMMNEAVDTEHFYRTLRMASVAQSINGRRPS